MSALLAFRFRSLGGKAALQVLDLALIQVTRRLAVKEKIKPRRLLQFLDGIDGG
jgi:uncharacterized protein (DUF849 family)